MFSDSDSEVAGAEPGVWQRLGYAGMGALRVTLLFGSAAIALALILAPIARDHTRMIVAQADGVYGLDNIVTGTVNRTSGRYTVRRSVLQSSPDAVCIISDRGSKSGDC